MEKRLNILYISFTDLIKCSSGSEVRPIKMLKYFRETGNNIVVVKGRYKPFIYSERKKNIKQVIHDMKSIKFDLCYVEPTSGCISSIWDYFLLKSIVKNKIPIGYFYRDSFAKIGKGIVVNKKNFKGLLIEIYSRIFTPINDFLINKYCDIVYFPTIEMSKYFNFKNKKELLPGGEIIEYKCSHNRIPRVIYVGASSDNYGVKNLLETFSLINCNQVSLKLLIVTREEEFYSKYSSYANKKWLELSHVTGTNKLKKMYERADIAIAPFLRNAYSDIACSVKIFEYLSFGLPIVATNTPIMVRLIKDNNIGFICEDNCLSMKKIIENALFDVDELKNKRKAVKIFLKKKGLWSKRVSTVINDLSNIK
ncbi:MAG: glycosyltransferase [Bacilli bacterium]